MNNKKERKLFQHKLHVLLRLIKECTEEANELIVNYMELDNKYTEGNELKEWEEITKDKEKFLRIVAALQYIEEPTSIEVIETLKELIHEDEKEIKEKQRIRR